MNGQQRPVSTPRKKTFLNDYRQAHPATEEALPGGKYPAQLMWEQKNNGAIVLKVNDGIFEKGAKTTHKEVDLDAYDRGVFFEALLEASNTPDFKTKQIQVAKHQFVFSGGSGRMSDRPVTQVLLTITRDDVGQISCGYSKGDYKAIFRFKGPRQTVVITKNAAGERVEDTGLMSRWAVRNWVGFHKPVLERMELEGWEPPKPRNQPDNNNNRTNNNNNATNGTNDFDSGGGNDFDDDF